MKKDKIYDISIIAMFLVLLSISSKITFSIVLIPFTMQMFFVFLIPLLLKVKRSIVVFSLYIVIGILGLPVFAKGGGFSYILEPSFGYILGFLASTIIIGLYKHSNFFLIKYIYCIIGLIVVYVFGIAYMYFILNYQMGINANFGYVIEIGFLPFFLKDLVAMIIAVLIYSRLRKIPIFAKILDNKKTESIETGLSD